MTNLIPWQELPNWVPGEVLQASDDLGWRNVALRSYHYRGQDVVVPAMQDFMLVSYRTGVTPMQRRFDGRWSKETLSPGAASLLTRAQRAYWNWDAPIDVTHIYLSGSLVAEVASEMLDCVVSEVTLEDVLRTSDPVMTTAVQAISSEAQTRGLGGALYVDSIARGLIVHLIRRYAAVKTKPTPKPGELSPQRKRAITEFIEANLASALDLSVMSDELGMTPCLFARQFKKSFGQPPYAYVMARRIARAERLLARTDLAIKQIAAICGFSDQAHMTRLFRRCHGVPPAQYRRQTS
ncbi:MAG: AraC family transcriptional regulator [Pseudomonadota bacterium]